VSAHLRAHTQVRPYNNFVKYFRDLTLSPVKRHFRQARTVRSCFFSSGADKRLL